MIGYLFERGAIMAEEMFEARVERDSISIPGRRLLTLVSTYPRMIHSEVLTHRAFARNSSSSRAIPFEKMLAAVNDHPFVPRRWGAEAKGMQTGDVLVDERALLCERTWLRARDEAVTHAQELHRQGLHKSICNRILEPWAWITVVITATEWANFFRLRCHPDAEVHLQIIATMMHDRIRKSHSTLLKYDEYHSPFVAQDEFSDGETICMVSTARSARVSYLTHDGVRDVQKDLDLFTKLSTGSGFGHYSPYEHVCRPLLDPHQPSGPFRGYQQYRKVNRLENLETPLFYQPGELSYRPDVMPA